MNSSLDNSNADHTTVDYNGLIGHGLQGYTMLGTISIVSTNDSQLRDRIYDQRVRLAGYHDTRICMERMTVEQCAHAVDSCLGAVRSGQNVLVDSWPANAYTQRTLFPLLTRFGVRFITELVNPIYLAHEVGEHMAETNRMPKLVFESGDQSWTGDWNPEVILAGDVSTFKNGIGYPFMHATHSSLVFNEQVWRIGVMRKHRVAIVNVNNPNGFLALDNLTKWGDTKVIIALGLQAEVTIKRLKRGNDNLVGTVNHPSYAYRFLRNKWNSWGDELESIIDTSVSRLSQKEIINS
jgi:hypothetical protein